MQARFCDHFYPRCPCNYLTHQSRSLSRFTVWNMSSLNYLNKSLFTILYLSIYYVLWTNAFCERYIMRNAYVLFRSRNELMNFRSILQSYGVYSSMVNAPKSIVSSCSLAVMINPNDVYTAQSILSRRNMSGFNGMYVIDSNYGQRDVIRRIF